ncbi:MAG: hypothetical protein EOP04_04580 [Proteobacteria bacterium]|nr:MAG: hypothetical protein EOP04_04580 [Pseudomonadota bacterium]
MKTYIKNEAKFPRDENGDVMMEFALQQIPKKDSEKAFILMGANEHQGFWDGIDSFNPSSVKKEWPLIEYSNDDDKNVLIVYGEFRTNPLRMKGNDDEIVIQSHFQEIQKFENGVGFLYFDDRSKNIRFLNLMRLKVIARFKPLAGYCSAHGITHKKGHQHKTIPEPPRFAVAASIILDKGVRFDDFMGALNCYLHYSNQTPLTNLMNRVGAFTFSKAGPTFTLDQINEISYLSLVFTS